VCGDVTSSHSHPSQLRTRAWLVRARLGCEEGWLELADGMVRFTATDGSRRFEARASECEVRFPRGSVRTGLDVRSGDVAVRVWFSNPYLAVGGLGGFGSSRAVATEWHRAVSLFHHV
jgi:hypothetical protein